MDVSRRDFLKISGSTLAAASVGIAGDPENSSADELRIKDAKKTTVICPYCSVGCGIVAHVKDGKVVNTEGDADHPINQGTLCSKGGSVYQLVNNPQRLTRPRYRAPGSNQWKEVEWDWALDQIARRIKDTRDRTFRETAISKVKERKRDLALERAGIYVEPGTDVEKRFTVNRTEGIAHVGSAALDNEECWMLQKMLRSWGLVYIEHQARI